MEDARDLVPGVDHPRTFREVDEWLRGDNMTLVSNSHFDFLWVYDGFGEALGRGGLTAGLVAAWQKPG